ncbi:uncharacterized protein LOC117106492 [Anneissia japonica]|uniref:uncharacterized protein LOC117106492 n=1 Tax=Anneissia japonica TaxID=1529436 RepID=UPI001425B3A1|nr:uncharacterized protein LOC117106492 [Anneissia japonica]
MDVTCRQSSLKDINNRLHEDWQAKINQEGRIYYLNHRDRVSQWLPPAGSWNLRADLPYGWEAAIDEQRKPYYIDHVTEACTRADPFEADDIQPVEREVTLIRDSALGFGFIAGSERPVVVRSVTEGGPSVDKLLPGDEICRIDDENVRMCDREYIINKIRNSTESIRLTVIQPYIDKTGLKSSFLSATKKHKLKNKPTRVRFAESPEGMALTAIQGKVPASLVYLPSVLKVYLENNQTKSFKYDSKTNVKDVLNTLQEKLGITCMQYFALVMQDMRSTSHQKFILLHEAETLQNIASRPGAQHWKCLFRIAFVPKDAYDLLTIDENAFEYFYLQCCNDVINERFASELKFDVAVRLASLHIHEHVLSNHQTSKVSQKLIEKEGGLDRFLPKSIIQHMKGRELRRMINHYIKQNQNLTAPGQKHLTALQTKLHYLKIVGEQRTFGGKFYYATQLSTSSDAKRADVTLLIGPKCGITQVIHLKSNITHHLADFDQLDSIQLSQEGNSVIKLTIGVKNEEPIILMLHADEAQDLINLINGYHRLNNDDEQPLVATTDSHSFLVCGETPAYRGRHTVAVSDWNYPSDMASENLTNLKEDGYRLADFSQGPPPFQEDPNYKISPTLPNLRSSQDYQNHNGNNALYDPLPVSTILNSPVYGSPQSPSEHSSDDSSLEGLLESMYNSKNNAHFDRSQDQAGATTKNLDSVPVKEKRRRFSDILSPKRRTSLSDMHFDITDTVATNDIKGDYKKSKDSHVQLLKFRNVHSSSDESDSELEENKSSVPSGHQRVTPRDSMLLPKAKHHFSLWGFGKQDSISGSFKEEPDGGTINESNTIDLTLNGSHNLTVENHQSVNGETKGGDKLMENEADSESNDSDIPVSVIDLPSNVEENECCGVTKPSDEAHGIQLAAIDAFATLDAPAYAPREAKRKDIGYESDSGNETISSEIIDNGDVVGFSNSPSDYLNIQSDLDDENQKVTQSTGSQSQLGATVNVTLQNSDTDSSSTFRGSTPNLSNIEVNEESLIGSEEMKTVPEDFNSIDTLIASMMVPPPPSGSPSSDDFMNTLMPPPNFGDDDSEENNLIVPPPHCFGEEIKDDSSGVVPALDLSGISQQSYEDSGDEDESEDEYIPNILQEINKTVNKKEDLQSTPVHSPVVIRRQGLLAVEPTQNSIDSGFVAESVDNDSIFSLQSASDNGNRTVTDVASDNEESTHETTVFTTDGTDFFLETLVVSKSSDKSRSPSEERKCNEAEETKQDTPPTPIPPPRKKYNTETFKKKMAMMKDKQSSISRPKSLDCLDIKRSSSMKVRTGSMEYLDNRNSVAIYATIKRSSTAIHSKSPVRADVLFQHSSLDTPTAEELNRGLCSPTGSKEIHRSQTFSSRQSEKVVPHRKAPPPPKPIKPKRSPSPMFRKSKINDDADSNITSPKTPSKKEALLKRPLSFSNPFTRAKNALKGKKSEDSTDLTTNKPKPGPKPLKALKSLGSPDAASQSTSSHSKAVRPHSLNLSTVNHVESIQRDSNIVTRSVSMRSQKEICNPSQSPAVSPLKHSSSFSVPGDMSTLQSPPPIPCYRPHSPRIPPPPKPATPPAVSSRSQSPSSSLRTSASSPSLQFYIDNLESGLAYPTRTPSPVTSPSPLPKKYQSPVLSPVNSRCVSPMHISKPGPPVQPKPQRGASSPSPSAASLKRQDSVSDSPPPLPSTTPPIPSYSPPQGSTSPSPSPPPALPASLPPGIEDPFDISPDSPVLPDNTYGFEDNTQDDVIAMVMETEYSGENALNDAIQDVKKLVSFIEKYSETVTPIPNATQFQDHKQSLVANTKEFTGNVKLLVSSAALSFEKLTSRVEDSVHTLARLYDDSRAAIASMSSVMQAHNLGTKVCLMMI